MIYKIILKHTYDGLGDNLCHSTLPEIFHNMGCEVYISSKQGFRNTEVRDLIFANPFIKGVSDEEPNINIDEIFKTRYPVSYPNKNYTARIEYTLFNKVYNQYPKIYYTPKLLPEWQDKTFIDFNSISVQHNVNKFLHYAKQNNNNCVQTLVEYKPASLFEYIDIIYSCRKFLCTYTGSMVLASAINKKNVDCYITDDWVTGVIKNGGYCYHFDNVNYIAIDNTTNSIMNIMDTQC